MSSIEPYAAGVGSDPQSADLPPAALVAWWASRPAPVETPTVGGGASLPCPPWCTSEHEPIPDPTLGPVPHEVRVAEVETASPSEGAPATVDVGIYDSVVTGLRSPALVWVECRGELDASGARELAAALVRAARLIEDWSR